MKRFLIIFLFICSDLYAAQLLKQSTATQVDIKFVDATDGFTAETGLTVTTFDCNLIKHADSGIAATALTITASGGNNDSAHLADGIYSLELTGTDTNTLGRLDLYCQATGARPFEAHYTVVASGVYDQSITTALASIDDHLNSPCSGVTDPTSWAWRVCQNLDISISSSSPWAHTTTIATLASQTSFTLTNGSSNDDAYNDWMILITGSSPLQVVRATVSDYVGSTKTITLRSDPAIFTMAVGDTVQLAPAVTANEIWSYIIETGWTATEILRVMSAVTMGKSSGFNTNTPAFRDVNDSKNRVTSTTNNTGRTSVTFDKSP